MEKVSLDDKNAVKNGSFKSYFNANLNIRHFSLPAFMNNYISVIQDSRLIVVIKIDVVWNW